MGIFDFFRKRPKPPPDLRQALILATARQDWDTVTELCQEHSDQIRSEFPIWKTVPVEIRQDRGALSVYAQMLITVARLFEQGGDGSLLASMIGNPDDNPITLWQRALVTAQSFLDGDKPKEAAELLQSTLQKHANLTGDGADHLLPRTLGMLGVALFEAGDHEEAITVTRRAKTLCEEAGDAEGIAIYEANLKQMAGGSEVVFRNEAGKSLSIAELQRTAGRVRYEVRGGESIPRAAEELHQRARQIGSTGDYQQAMNLLEQAVEKAPQWPYPLYDLAFTYLLMKNTEQAIEHYRKTLALAPRGFFTAITALHTLEREQRGELPEGLYLAYLSIENIDDRAEKANLARQLVEKMPSFAPAWKDLAIATDQSTERQEAIQKGLAASPDAETKGILQINEALGLHARGEQDAAIRLLEALSRDEASTYATEHMASAALAVLSPKAN